MHSIFMMRITMGKNATGLAISLNSVREQYHNLLDNGFPYLMISPGFLLLIFVVIFPIIFVILLSFTNYDLYHSPPAKLVDWVGIQNYIDIFKLDLWSTHFLVFLAGRLFGHLEQQHFKLPLVYFLAVVVNQKDLKGKAFFRTIFNLTLGSTSICIDFNFLWNV